MTPIADMVEQMVANGVAGDMISLAVATCELVRDMSGTLSRTNYQTYERDRKREWRKTNKTGNKSDAKQTMRAATVSRNVPDSVPDSVAPPSLTSFLTSSSDVLLASKQGSKEEVVARRDRGTRIPPDWHLSPQLTSLALEHGHSPPEFETEFKDFWIAIPGARGRKCDWDATARNRIKETGKRRRMNGNGHGKRTIMEAADDLLERVRGFDAPAPGGLRDGTRQADARLLPKG